MTDVVSKAPFLEDLRQKWQSGAMTTEEILSEVLHWEDDINQRTNEELDEAWAFRQEVEDSSGLKSASDLQVLLDTSAVQHIDSVLRDLENVASAGRLNDSYEGVIRTVIQEGGPRYRQSLRKLLSGLTTISPGLQGILDEVGGGAPGSAPVYQADEDEDADVADVEEQDEEDGSEAEAAASSAGPVSQSQPRSKRTVHSSQDPWLMAQRFINLGRWEDARQAVSQIPADHPRADEVPNVLAAIDEGEIYDQVPGLRNMLPILASSRSRRDWAEFKRRRAEAEKLIADASAQVGRPIQMPRSLGNIFDEAVKAQDAEALVAKAVQERERGDFPGAATSLTEALTLDPRYARVQSEQQLNADLQNLLYSLRRNPLNTATELADGLAICEQLLEANAAPGSTEVSNRRDTILGKIDKLIDTIRRRIDGRQRAIKDPGDLDQKMGICDAIDQQLDQIEALRKDDPDLQDLRDWTDATRRRLRDLIAERDAIANYVTNLDPSSRVEGPVAENWSHRLASQVSEPLVQGDSTTHTLAQTLAGKLSAYLDTILLPGMALDLPTLENAAEVLRLAQTGAKGLTPQQSAAYSRSLWVAGASLVRSLLPKTLPPYEPPQSGQPFTPRSSDIIASWDQALRVLEWLRNLPGAISEQQTIEALERDFALSVSQILETTSTFPRRITKDESEERVVTARTIKQYIHTLPDSIRAKIPPQVLTSKRTQTESVVRRRKTVSVAIPIVLLLLLLGATTAGGMTIKKAIDDNNATATAVARYAGATAVAQSTQTAVSASATKAASVIIEKNRFAWMDPFLEPEVNANNPSCTFVSTSGDKGFNVCDTGAVHFKEYYSRSGWAEFLGAPISKLMSDPTEQGKWTQYFERGRLEQGSVKDRPVAEFGRLGYEVFTQVFGFQADGTGLRVDDASTPISPDWGAVEGFTPRIRTIHGFLDFFNTHLGAKGTWNPVDFYGGPVSQEYQVGSKPVFRQFFERAIFEWKEGGKVEALPVGKIYLKLVRNRNIELADDYMAGMGQK